MSYQQAPPPPPAPPVRSRKRLYVIAIAVVLIGVVLVSLVLWTTFKSSPNNPTVKSWHLFDFISNKEGSYDSPVFSIDNSWRVIWNVTHRRSEGQYGMQGSFDIYVMAKFDIEWHAIANASNTSDVTLDSGVFNVNSTGIFYLQVLASLWVKWELEVQEYR
jgi:hypothetical protein